MRKVCTLFVLSLMIGCKGWNPGGDRAATVVVLDLEDEDRTRSTLPDETLVSDINLLIYNAEGVLEEQRFLRGNQREIKTALLTETAYDLFVCANLGYPLPALARKEIEEYRYFMAYPDEYSRGMPMSGRLDGFVSHGKGSVRIPLVRAMARVDLRIDRTRLDSDVTFQVTSVTVGGCPSSVRLFSDSRAESATQVFASGFTLNGRQVQALNMDRSPGVSGSVNLYLLENLQGDLLDTDDETGKAFSEGPYAQVCSYIEIRGTYYSDSWHTFPGETLSYRFFLGDGPGNFDVYRNTACQVTVRLEGTGLSEESWRIDKGGMAQQTSFNLYPAAYNECQPGDDFHLWCDVLPADTPFEIEPVAWDDDEGVHNLYTFDIDPDGHGLTIHTWKGGSVMVYFKAGPPVDRDTLALLVIGP